MAKGNTIIPPFPAEIDRAHFASWLSGFSDGEACFLLAWNKAQRTGLARFVIGLRFDDRDVLEMIRSFWNCGWFFLDHNYSMSARSINRPTMRYVISHLDDMAEIVIPHFERHPLMAKKARDFAIWKEAVGLLRDLRAKHIHSMAIKRGRRGNRPVWTDDDRGRFVLLHDRMRSVRSYETAPAESPIDPPQVPMDRQATLW